MSSGPSWLLRTSWLLRMTCDDTCASSSLSMPYNLLNGDNDKSMDEGGTPTRVGCTSRSSEIVQAKEDDLGMLLSQAKEDDLGMLLSSSFSTSFTDPDGERSLNWLKRVAISNVAGRSFSHSWRSCP